MPANAAPPAAATETATFALGCFWKPDALFGLQQGVVRTRVGYAGGSSPAPTYRSLGNHIESLQLEHDPQQIGYEQLLDFFFSWHTPTRPPYKRQYASAIFYHTPAQHQQALAKKEGRTAAEHQGSYAVLPL
ncbi:peptide-methionine (S)-S-oxide reductase [Cesiribacter andamanensis]|uniref:peptide-methionine (S)-S-oxide reductase n=1 Tax=Cesiribacter andamanensis AMV16 TaxID=1279009 RepID=M7N7X7_9BACT|nr:peptide-methionine (S)-S-oxide reductase [Cesiribacter andamanensis]EMR03352.1 Peptide methionine sulfoxide reductase MsrA [Cesiribacter andamanensis AMV16]